MKEADIQKLIEERLTEEMAKHEAKIDGERIAEILKLYRRLSADGQQKLKEVLADA